MVLPLTYLAAVAFKGSWGDLSDFVFNQLLDIAQNEHHRLFIICLGDICKYPATQLHSLTIHPIFGVTPGYLKSIVRQINHRDGRHYWIQIYGGYMSIPDLVVLRSIL